MIFTFHTQYWEYTHYVPFPQEIIQEFLKNAVHRWLREFMRKCQHIIIPSESLRDILVREYGLHERYSVIPTGTNLEPFLNADGKALRVEQGWQKETVLISVGRLAPEKNWDTLIQAFAKVHAEHPEARLVLIGDGPARQNLETLAAELGIAAQVTFTGSIPFEEIPRYLKAADLFVFASITETQGIVTIEAMAAGLPVVAVDGPGTRDIVQHGKQGYLVDNNPDALAKKLNQLLSKPERLKGLSTQALKRAKAFDVNQLSKQLIGVYEQAIQDKNDDQYVTLKIEETPPQQQATSLPQTQ
jgi:glycosyltransferase involved in cell wall biosynthesis